MPSIIFLIGRLICIYIYMHVLGFPKLVIPQIIHWITIFHDIVIQESRNRTPKKFGNTVYPCAGIVLGQIKARSARAYSSSCGEFHHLARHPGKITENIPVNTYTTSPTYHIFEKQYTLEYDTIQFGVIR